MEKTKEIDILDVLIILAKHKKFIFWTTLIASIITVIYVLIVPQYWLSSTSFMPVSSNSGITDSSNLLSKLGVGMMQDANQMDIISILESRTFLEKIMRKHKIREYYKIVDQDSLIVNQLCVDLMRNDMIKINKNPINGMIVISILTKDKSYSSTIANSIVSELDHYNRTYRMSKGKESRIFLEKRIDDVNDRIKSLTQNIKDFQDQHNILMIDKQISEQIQIYSSLIADYFKTEIEIAILRQSYDDENRQLSTKLLIKNHIQKQIHAFEETKSDLLPEFFISMNSVTGIIQKLALLELELSINKKTLEFLYPQYELSKLQELEDTNSIQIIDYAIPAGERSKPQRAYTCIAVFIISIILTSSLSSFYEYFQKYKNQSQNMHKLLKLKKNLLLKK